MKTSMIKTSRPIQESPESGSQTIRVSRDDVWKLFAPIALVILINLQACLEEEPIPPSVIQFSKSLQNVPEGGEAMIELTLDRPASGDESVTIMMAETNSIYNQHYTTNPPLADGKAVLPVDKGQKSAVFTVTAMNNTLFDEGRFTIFKVTNPTKGLQLGTTVSQTLTIMDDEGPSLANFAENVSVINEEDGDGITVGISLSAPANSPGTLAIVINPGGATYGTDFITSPAATGNSISLNILPGDLGASFKVLPVHNFIVTQNQQVGFSISAATGVVRKGTSLAYSLTIVEADLEALVNFAENAGVMDENDPDGITIEIPLSAPAPGNGSITVTFTSNDATYGNQFTTIPSAAGNNTITLNISNQQPGASFKVLPVNDQQCSSSGRLVQFRISIANGSVKTGTEIEYSLTLKDDEETTIVSFTESSGLLDENNVAGIAVQLNFSNPISQDAQIYVSGPYYEGDPYNGYIPVYGNVYTTVPEMYPDYYSTQGFLTLTVLKDAVNSQFTVLPGTVNNDYFIGFFMGTYSNTGCIQVAPNNGYSLTIVDYY